MLLFLMAAFTTYLIGHGFFHWYSANSKTIVYVAQSIAFIYYPIEIYNGFKDKYQRDFCVIGLFAIAVNSIIYALNFQGIIKNAVWLLLILWISVGTITIGVIFNLKKYDYI
jgi:hypothetical protein